MSARKMFANSRWERTLESPAMAPQFGLQHQLPFQLWIAHERFWYRTYQIIMDATCQVRWVETSSFISTFDVSSFKRKKKNDSNEAERRIDFEETRLKMKVSSRNLITTRLIANQDTIPRKPSGSFEKKSVDRGQQSHRMKNARQRAKPVTRHKKSNQSIEKKRGILSLSRYLFQNSFLLSWSPSVGDVSVQSPRRVNYTWLTHRPRNQISNGWRIYHSNRVRVRPVAQQFARHDSIHFH